MQSSKTILVPVCMAVLLLTACGGSGGGGGGSTTGTSTTGSSSGSSGSGTTGMSTGGTSGGGTTSGGTTTGGTGSGGIIDDHTIELRAASHVGTGSDAFVASVILNDGLMLGGVVTDTTGLTVRTLHAGDGLLIKVTSDGSSSSDAVRVGASVNDAELHHGTGGVAVCGDDFVGVLLADWSAFSWRLPQAADRVAAGSDGTVAAVAGKTLSAWDAAGNALFMTTLSDTDVADVCVHGGNDLVIVTGYNQVSANLKTPYLRAYTYAGAVAWEVYHWSAAEVNAVSLGADSEGRRLAIGADGRLYLAGSTDGGTTVFARLPNDLNAGAGLSTPDNHQQPVNLSGSARLAFIGRFDVSDGSLLGGTWLLARLLSGKQNTIHIRDIAADATGAVAVVGETRWAIAHRDDLMVNSVATIGAGQYLCLFDSSFMRTAWLVFGTADGGGGSLRGVAIDDDQVLVGGADPADAQVTVGSITPANNGAWFGLLPRASIGGSG